MCLLRTVLLRHNSKDTIGLPYSHGISLETALEEV
jgi:hypothetical protein